MSVDVKYRTSATANGDRDGNIRTEDGNLGARLTTPKELGGPGGEGTNPEQLFAGGYSACFVSSIKAAGRQLKLKVPSDVTVTATVGIGARSEGGFGSGIAKRSGLESFQVIIAFSPKILAVSAGPEIGRSRTHFGTSGAGRFSCF